MSNPREAALLKSDEYRRKCAKAIAEAIAEVYRLTPVGLKRKQQSVPEAPKPFDPGAGTTIINTWLKPMWMRGDEDTKAYAHWLAQQVRAAFGLPPDQ